MKSRHPRHAKLDFCIGKERNLNDFGEQCNYLTDILLFKIIDGKVCNAVTSTTSSRRCYLCDEKSKTFNNILIDAMSQKQIDTSTVNCGLSTLHAWIRTFERLIHLVYKLNIGKWQIRKEEHEEKVAENKGTIQNEFKEKLGQRIDQQNLRMEVTMMAIQPGDSFS